MTALPSHVVTQTCIKGCGAQVLSDGSRQLHNDNVCENNGGRNHVYKSLDVQKIWTRTIAQKPKRSCSCNTYNRNQSYLQKPKPTQYNKHQVTPYGTPHGTPQSGSITQFHPYIPPPNPYIPTHFKHTLKHRYNNYKEGSRDPYTKTSNNYDWKDLKRLFPDYAHSYLKHIASSFTSWELAVDTIIKQQDQSTNNNYNYNANKDIDNKDNQSESDNDDEGYGFDTDEIDIDESDDDMKVAKKYQVLLSTFPKTNESFLMEMARKDMDINNLSLNILDQINSISITNNDQNNSNTQNDHSNDDAEPSIYVHNAENYDFK